MSLTNLAKAPFPWFGGKSDAAPLVWSLLGDVEHYVEPFAGSLAVLLNRPHPCNRSYYSETVNDLDGFVVNAWRALALYPEETARAASWPVAEADKTARQIALLKWRDERGAEHLAGTADWCDPTMAGWWLWSVCVQIGAFSGDGAWTADPVTGCIVKMPSTRAGREPGVTRNMPHLSDNGMGVNHPGTRETGVSRARPHLSDNGMGVNSPGTREPGVSRNLPHLSNNGRGVNHAGTREPGVFAHDDPTSEFHDMTMPELVRWFRWLSARMRHVRILNGDWSRAVTTGAAHTLSVRQGGMAGIFLDPPYDSAIRAGGLYQAHADSGDVATQCRAWCIEAGKHPKNRIVLAGYDTEHVELEAHGWRVYDWFKAGFLKGGMGNIGKRDDDDDGPAHQQHRERLWASPHCIVPQGAGEQRSLF